MKIPFRNKVPLLLSIVSCVGVIGTGVVAAIQTPKAIKRLEESNAKTLPQKVLAVTPSYLPAAGIAVGTIFAILGANGLNRKQQAMLISGYTALEQSFKAYRKKTAELYGEDADKTVQQSIQQDIFEADPERKTRHMADDERWFFCPYADSDELYFISTVPEVQKAIHQLNKKLTIDGQVSVNDFLKFLHLDTVYNGNCVGWSIEQLMDLWNAPWIEFCPDPVYSREEPDRPPYYDLTAYQDPTERYLDWESEYMFLDR